MARRRSPPRRGGSSDAARTLVTRHARDSGRAMPYAARQRGGRGTTLADLQIVTVGCPNAGLGVVGGKGCASPLSPATSLLSMPVRLLRRLTVTALSGRHSVARREATTPGCRATSAGQRKKREPCSGKKIDAHARGKPKPQSRAKKKYSVAKEHGKESKKGRTKFSSGKAECKRTYPPGSAKGRR